jgi:hypothetical protein
VEYGWLVDITRRAYECPLCLLPPRRFMLWDIRIHLIILLYSTLCGSVIEMVFAGSIAGFIGAFLFATYKLTLMALKFNTEIPALSWLFVL